MRARRTGAALAFAACLLAGGGAAAQHAGHRSGAPQTDIRPAPCRTADAAPAPLCAEVPTAFVDAKGTWWLAWTQGGHVYVATAGGPDKPFSSPVAVTPSPMRIDRNGENRPKVAVDADGTVYVSFAAKGERKYTGVVYFSRSLDGGRTFTAPRPVSDAAKPSSQRFDSLAVTPKGRVYLAWLDKRDSFAAEAANRPYRGIGVYYTWSDDGGRTFAPNTRAAEHSCECCRTALAFDGEVPVAVWRHVFEPNHRDHAVMRLEPGAKPVRLSEDRWAIDGCPHHGPAIAIADDGTYHVVWYTGAERRSGLFHARSDDGGRTFSRPFGFGDADAQASHPHVLAVGEAVFVAWKESTGDATEVYVMQSADGGRSWSVPLRAAHTDGPGDHPFLLRADGWVLLSWGTMAEGWRAVRVAPLNGGRAGGR